MSNKSDFLFNGVLYENKSFSYRIRSLLLLLSLLLISLLLLLLNQVYKKTERKCFVCFSQIFWQKREK